MRNRTTRQAAGRSGARRAAALAAVAVLALAGCDGGDEEDAPGDDATATEAPNDPGADGGDEDSSDGGGEDGAAVDPADPGSHYLFLPQLDGAETISGDAVDGAVGDFLEGAEVTLDCPGDVSVGEQITCTDASIEGSDLVEVSDTWDVALVRTTNENTALIVRAAADGAGSLPLPLDQVFHFAYLVDEEETPEVIAAGAEEGFFATQVSDGPADVDVAVACERGREYERSAECAVEGDQPEDAAGEWFGVGHDSFVEGSAVYLFVENPAR